MKRGLEGRGPGRGALAGLACALLLLPAVAAAQNVLWEDFRGLDNVPADGVYVGAPGAPKFQNFPNSGAMAPFRALAANPANAARSGSSPDINFLGSNASASALCNNGAPGSQACVHQAQGRVLHALIQFPEAGAYTLRAAHDDNLVVEFSTDYTNTSFRSASYDIPVGALSEWTANENTYATIGTFTAANAGSCALVRVFWTNQGGINHNRLQWTTPSNVTQIVPASAFRNPSLPDSANGCNGSITGNGTAVTLNKVLGSPRLDGADQFTIEIGTSPAGGTVRSAVTTGSGTGQQASTGAFPAATNVTYYLREVMAPGSASALTAYAAEISCTRSGTPFTPTPVGPPGNRRWSVTPAANDQIVCSITNTAPMADLEMAKTTDAPNVASGDEVGYTLVVTNHGPDAATGATVTDVPGTGVTCPAGGAVACASTATPSACPASPGPLTIQALLDGVALGTLPVGDSVTFSYTCIAD